MKNRKFIVAAFLLAAAMLLGVGYAALTDELAIAGTLKTDTTASMDEFDGDVYFSAASIIRDDTGNKSVAQILEGRDDAKIEALHFTENQQTVVAKFTITNLAENEFAALIDGSSVTVTNDAVSHDPVFGVTWSWSDTVLDTNNVTLQPGESKDLWVTITLNETPQEIHNAAFTITYTANSVDKTP
jgi:hypothetical protein